ncbi:unnamed protein product [Prorocentrum cordatum]|uniref:Peptidylamidoglycolate lyase n=1 Tax=Prorocentrum cordatum TaxID=2364126 RepID=A0ABN9SEB2_9DINO|nr:unnamed protein product [Polarella glacialis]
MRPPAGTQMYPTSYFGAAAPFWLKPPRRISGRGTGQLESTARHPNGGHGMGQSALSRTAEATTVSTLAGSDASGYADGQGAAASFYRPTGVAVDGAGNVFVADCYNHRIRKISAGGAVSTLAGSGASGREHAGGQRRFGARGRAGRGGQLLVSAGGGGGRRGQRVRGRLLQPPHPEDLGGRSREHAGRQRRFGP